MHLKKLVDIKELAQAFDRRPQIIDKGDEVHLVFDAETETGEYKITGIAFLGAIAYRFTKEHCAGPDVLDAYNAIALNEGSHWLRDVGSNCRTPDGSPWDGSDLIHYVVYFDGFGAYEFLARDFRMGVDA